MIIIARKLGFFERQRTGKITLSRILIFSKQLRQSLPCLFAKGWGGLFRWWPTDFQNRFRLHLTTCPQSHIGQIRSSNRTQFAERTAHEKSCFQRQLWRQQHMRLLGRWCGAGLVIDHFRSSVAHQINTVGTARQGNAKAFNLALIR